MSGWATSPSPTATRARAPDPFRRKSERVGWTLKFISHLLAVANRLESYNPTILSRQLVSLGGHLQVGRSDAAGLVAPPLNRHFPPLGNN